MIPVPDPLVARLTEPFGGPLVLERICLETDIGGSFDAPGTLEVLTTMFGFLDVAMVDAGCDASVEVVLSGERIPAQYDFANGDTRTCYSGLSIEGSVGVEIDGQVTGALPIAAREQPPDTVDFCQGDEPFSAGSYLNAPLSEIFGMPGLVALAAARDTDSSAHLPADLDSEEALEAVLSGLYHEDDRVRLVAFLALSGRFTWLDELSQDQIDVIPRLIAALDYYVTTGLDPSPSLSLSLVDALDDLVGVLRGTGQLPGGFMRDCPADWWLLWLDEWESSAPCDHIEVSS